MAEPSTSAGVSLTFLAVALLGPMAGPYAVIVFSALAGSMWPLSSSQTLSRIAGAGMVLRCTLTAIILTSLLAALLEKAFGVRSLEWFGPVAMTIGALGNGWKPVFNAIGSALKTAIGNTGDKA